jgi:hypothetical protein
MAFAAFVFATPLIPKVFPTDIHPLPTETRFIAKLLKYKSPLITKSGT